MNELLTSILHRPYVFIFLAAYLFLGWWKWGWRRTILWLVSGYAIAWASEFSSINNGFPYGEYHYIYADMPGELMVAGVPFFDSISYPFLIFAGYAAAEFVLSGNTSIDFLKSHTSIKKAFIGALLTMLLDVIIDPVAKLGKQWFLGDIYYYAEPGWYFDVPLSNFGGWFLVSFAVIAFNILVWKAMPMIFHERPAFTRTSAGGQAFIRRWLSSGTGDERRNILFPLFYISIALFNIAVTFWIGATFLGVSSTTILIIIVVAIRGLELKKRKKTGVKHALL